MSYRNLATVWFTSAVLILIPNFPARAADGPKPDPTRPRGVPQELDTSRVRLSEGRHFRVALRSPGRRLEINRIHAWMIQVSDPEGRPVTDAHVHFDGGMPAHNHGFPTQPSVTEHLADGTYRIEGVKFNMTGWWEFVVRIHAQDVSDVVRFNVVVED